MENQDLPYETSQSSTSTEKGDVLTSMPIFLSKKEKTPLKSKDEDAQHYCEYETPSNWQKNYHNYITPKDAENSNFMVCLRSPTDDLFAKQSEPVVFMDNLDKLFEEMIEYDKDVPIQETDALSTPLLLHQKMALNWMTKRENSTEMAPFWEAKNNFYHNQATLKWQNEKPNCIKGGILADDMGLGKTLLTIALILGNHHGSKPMFARLNKKTTSACISASSSDTGCMVIADDDPIMQQSKRKNKENNDEENIIRFKKKKEGYIKPQKIKSRDLKQPGFQFRQLYLSEIKKKDKKSSKSKRHSTKGSIKEEKSKTSVDALTIFSDSDDDDLSNIKSKVDSIVKSPALRDKNSQKVKTQDEKSEAKSTLIICPMSVLSNWTDQFQQHVDPGIDLKLYLYYGSDRVKDLAYIKQQDIVLTTYSTLASDFRQENSPLHKVTWLRIVLDEGHVIRNERSSQSVATVMLSAKRRWVLTGTPIQNRMSDLLTVFKFLRFEPFTDKQWWNGVVLAPMRSSNPNTYNRLKKLMQHVCIRRLKTDLLNGRAIVELPQKRVITQEIVLKGDQKEQYEAMQTKGKHTLVRYFRMGEKYVLRHYASILVIIMRLRQVCCHPRLCRNALRQMEQALDVMGQLEKWQQQDNANQDLQVNGAEASTEPDADEQKLIDQLMQVLAAGDSEACAVCLDNLTNAVITRCAHVFCSGCINDVIDSPNLETLCPLCRAEICKNQLIKVPDKPAEEEPIVLSEEELNWQSSAKVDALMSSLEEIRSEDPSVKCLIVSQFTSFLNLIQIPLMRARFHYTRLDGTMLQPDRAEAIRVFNEKSDESPTIMLLSLNAGGVGLTLTAATRVFLMDPAWNPAGEEQCFNRCHRLGQTKDVIVTKYVVKDSIEERMLELQEKKKKLMEHAFGGMAQQQNIEERRRDRLQELRTLIGI